MFKLQYSIWLCALSAAGCQSFPPDLFQNKETLQKSNETISITRTSGSSTPGSIHTHCTWEFRPSGECHIINTSRVVAHDFPAGKSESQWQSVTDYERCRDLLKRSGFFQMKENNGGLWPGATYSQVEVAHGSMKHQITFNSSRPPNEINALMRFLDKCTRDSESKVENSK